MNTALVPRSSSAFLHWTSSLVIFLFAGSCSGSKRDVVENDSIAPMVITIHSKRDGEVGRDEIAMATFQFTNTSSEPQIYFRRGFRMSLEVIDLAEERPKVGRLIFSSGGGFRSTASCQLSASQFISLKPSERFSGYQEDVRQADGGVAQAVPNKNRDTGYETEYIAGRYRLTVKYEFDRFAYMGQCENYCARHNDPEMIWNKAVSGPIEAHVDYSIR